MIGKQSYDMMLANLERAIRLDRPVRVNRRRVLSITAYTRTASGRLNTVSLRPLLARISVGCGHIKLYYMESTVDGEPRERSTVVRSIEVIEE